MPKIQFIPLPGKYPGITWGRVEYPLFDKSDLCPRPRYVGGTSNYLCECDHPRECPGVQAVLKEHYPDQITEG